MSRAPVLVALALIQYGMTPEEAINLLRQERPGAINLSQTTFVLKFEGERQSNSCCFGFQRTK